MAYHKSSTSILSSLDKDYIEEGRNDIYKWGEKRSTRRRGIRGWGYAFKKRFFDKSILKSFKQNLTLSLLLQLILSGLFTYTCQKLGLHMDVHIALFVSPIIFPLAFSINADFQRREHVLEDLALFKGGLIVLFFCHRDWHNPAGLGQEFLKASTNKLKGLILNVKEYLLTEHEVKRSFILQVIYEDFSDISQMNEKIRVALPMSHPLINRVIHCHNLIFWAFERLRVIREYRSPRGIRSFTKVFIFVMPLLLSPYYVFVGISSGNGWSPYYISLVTTFVFGTLQGVQDVLDDPFDGISEDDVNLGSLEDWTAHSLLTNRTYTIGRFTVTASVKSEETPKEVISVESRKVARSPSFKEKVNAPLRSILRRASQSRYDSPERERPDTLSTVSEEDVGVLFPAGVALSLETMKQKGITGSTTILPGFNIKEHKGIDEIPLEMLHDVDGAPATPLSLHRNLSDSDIDAARRRRAYRHKNVSFSQDLDDCPGGNNSLENSLNAGDDFPLLRDSPKLQANKRSQALEPDPDKFSKDLLESIGKLQHTSGTERVCPARGNANEKMPTSLASLFQTPTSSKDNNYSNPIPNNKIVSDDHSARTDLTSRENNRSVPKQDKNKPLANNTAGQDPVKDKNKSMDKPRFSVLKADSDSTQRNSITTFTEDDQLEPRPSLFAEKPVSESTPKRDNISPQSSHDSTPSPSRNVKVQPPTKTLPAILSPQTSEAAVMQLGKTNRGLSNDEVLSSAKEGPKRSRFTVTASPSETSAPQEAQNRPSRFSVSSPKENKLSESAPQETQNRPSRFSVSSPIKSTESQPQQACNNSKSSVAMQPANSSNDTSAQEDGGLRERQSSFWDFSSDDAREGDPSVKTLSKNPSIEEMLNLSETTNNEVFI